jgi:predicted MPP superfamily phosphohydrolase
MTVEPSALLIPLVSWAPLGLAILGAQVFWVAICLRVRGRRLVLSGIALLTVDILLVMFMRACVAAMGRMDYSESFFRWRWFLLALVVAGVGLPVPLWALALRIVHRRRLQPGERTPLVHPVFQAALASWVTAAAIILATGGSFSFLPRPARITRVVVTIQGLPSQLDGFRIAVLSDHHIGRLMTPQRARKRLASLAHARPDLVVDLGDITEEDPRYQGEAARIVAEYKAPLGTFAVAGNFDVRCGTDTLREELGRVGVVYLENEAACVAFNGGDLWLVGLGDPWTGGADLDRALAAVPESATVVLLSHSPDIVGEVAGRGIPLMLSGHLHGGQIVVPFAGPALGMSRYGTRFAWGSWRVGPTQLVVSRSLGEEALPIRLFCPPEIVLLTLRAPP